MLFWRQITWSFCSGEREREKKIITTISLYTLSRMKMEMICLQNHTIALQDILTLHIDNNQRPKTNGGIEMIGTGRVSQDHLDEIRVEDIMDYFDEYINVEQAKVLLMSLGSGGGYFETMHRIRGILKEKGFDVPFRAGYRRTKI
jgi:hypothetical protein